MVLILIMLEYGLGVTDKKGNRHVVIWVLILIVLEYGLGGWSIGQPLVVRMRLNPYCAGIWSRSQ